MFHTVRVLCWGNDISAFWHFNNIVNFFIRYFGGTLELPFGYDGASLRVRWNFTSGTMASAAARDGDAHHLSESTYYPKRGSIVPEGTFHRTRGEVSSYPRRSSIIMIMRIIIEIIRVIIMIMIMRIIIIVIVILYYIYHTIY